MDKLDQFQHPQAAIAIDGLDADDPFVRGLWSLLEAALGKHSRLLWPPLHSSSSSTSASSLSSASSHAALPLLYPVASVSASALTPSSSPPPALQLLPRWLASIANHPCALLLFRPLHEPLLLPHLTVLRSSPTLPFLVVLYSAPAASVDARIASIRKSASLDPRSLLFLSTAAPKHQLAAFVRDLVLFAFSAATEHCSASFKRLRKDRYRKAPSGTQDPSRSLSIEYRLAHWSELKGEWAIALSHYSAAFQLYAALPATDRLDADELGDLLTLKICKLHAHLGHLSSCGSEFYHYLETMKADTADLWIAQRYEIFGDLFALAPAEFPLTFASENAPPESHFGNAGMAYFRAFLRLREGHGADRNHLLPLLSKARDVFTRGNNLRMVLTCDYHTAKMEYDRDNFSEFLKITDTIVPRLMESRWLMLFEELQQIALKCAQTLADFERQLRLSVSFLSKDISTSEHRDLFQSLLHADTSGSEDVEIDLQESPTLFSARVTYRESKAFVGSSIPIQFLLTSNIHGPLALSTIRIEFYGALKPVEFRSVASQDPSTLFKYHDLTSDMSLEGTGENSYFVVEADINVLPNSTLIFQFVQIPREVGDAKISSIVFAASSPNRTVRLVLPSPDLDTSHPHTWYESLENGGVKCIQQPLAAIRSNVLKILPKPPKIKIESSFEGPAFVGEVVPLNVEIVNEEDEDVVAEVIVRVKEEMDEKNQVSWTRDGSPTTEISKSLGIISTSASTLLYIHLLYQKQTTLELISKYTLPSDPATWITKSAQLKIQVISPFRATHKLLPRATQRESAAVFDLDIPIGKYITQSLYFVIGIMGIGPFELKIDKMMMKVDQNPVVRIDISPFSGCKSTEDGQIVIRQMSVHNASFEMTVEREIQVADLVIGGSLEMRWRRMEPLDESHEWVSTILSFPQLNIPNLSPTVLAELGQESPSLQDIIPITYHFDNPTYRTLDLLLNAESSEAVAYAGPRKLQFRLLPLSSHTLHYNLLPITLETSRLPLLRIIDTQTERALCVIGVGENLINDPNGIDIWYQRNISK
ncbi:hypothetical protein NEOLI_002495 [Neolecta irregularis DAH-3]|uniref:Trafficking protein particle complex subunit 11 n=1 Tax=Neolecta irregularis (strain DAH-3) TaxID=1198029 RepID=A0A1U7LUP2_NEOID|nr:hypothetical protein NEOLI_002495 [Neolecta irregularis DAH-3]|eukprot:OLL26364.1 hypothetical protein NEOLI_002495 [Neolecta irregularis DAH-3]